jgi:hypothetical protein
MEEPRVQGHVLRALKLLSGAMVAPGLEKAIFDRSRPVHIRQALAARLVAFRHRDEPRAPPRNARVQPTRASAKRCA